MHAHPLSTCTYIPHKCRVQNVEHDDEINPLTQNKHDKASGAAHVAQVRQCVQVVVGQDLAEHHQCHVCQKLEVQHISFGGVNHLKEMK